MIHTFHIFILKSDNLSGTYCLKDRQPYHKVSNSLTEMSC